MPSPLNMDFNPFVESMKALLGQYVNTEKMPALDRAIIEANGFKERAASLTQGILEKQLTPDFVIKRLKEEPVNLINFLRSEGIIQIANAERLATDITYKLITFIDEKLDSIKNAVDGINDNDSE